jgi:hypothetical protein
MRETAAYLDRLMKSAGLDLREEPRLRGEMSDHLDMLVQSGLAKGLTEERAVRAAVEAFGEPETLGSLLCEAHSDLENEWRKRFLYLKAACFVLFFGWAVNTFAYEVYYVAGHSVEPRLTQGSRVIVDKWNDTVRAGDIVAYREGERTFLGVVDGWETPGRLFVHRNGVARVVVEKPRLVGRVVCKIP